MLSEDEFLSERPFKVRVGSTLSELYQLEMGVPQGSILSSALKLTILFKGTDFLFVDDFALCVRSVQRVKRAMQLCVDSVQNWVSENGFKFSHSKTACIHFCRQNGVFSEPTILLD